MVIMGIIRIENMRIFERKECKDLLDFMTNHLKLAKLNF